MKLLLFDLDGTLVSTGGAGLRALDRAFLSLQRVVRASDGINFAGRTDPSIIRDIFRAKLNREPRDAEMRDIFTHYLSALKTELEVSDGYQVHTGVEPLLEALAIRAADAFLALGTGNLEEGARLKLEPASLNKYFSVGGFGSDAEDRPEVLRHGVRRAAEKAGRPFEGRDVVVIGDTIHDVSAGKALGAVTVAVATGHASEGELRASGADVVLPSLRDFSPLLSLLG
jgi:phosphoglycolate phosphatase-like HAD superfamily hydrolase